jgi:omega-amidase
MRFHAVQFDIAWEEKASNHARIEALLKQATVRPGDFVLLPELGDTGFSLDLGRIVDDRSAEWAAAMAKRSGTFLQHGFAGRGDEGMGRNIMGLFGPDGRGLGEYHKVHPFGYGRESAFYRGGDRLVLRKCGDATVCPLICYDLRFPELWRLAALSGAEVFTIGASWPSVRQNHWRSLLIARAIENQAYVVSVNRTGRDPNLAYSGGSMVVSPKGEIIVEAGAEERVLSADVDVNAVRSWRKEFPALVDTKRSLLGEINIDVAANPS